MFKRFVVFATLSWLAGGPAFAAQELDAQELNLGAGLIEQHRCAECHARRVGGDGSAIYRPGLRITSAGALRGMVEQCNTELNLGMFPEEVSAVARVLNQRHYGLD